MFRRIIVLSASLVGLSLATSRGMGPPEHHHEHVGIDVFLVDQAARPDAPGFRINGFDADRAVDALMGLPITAGLETLPVSKEVAPAPATASVWFSHPTFYAEYDYINSGDKRENGQDSEANSAVVGFDFLTISDILLGFTYSYSNRDAEESPLGFPDDENAHFFNLYTAKTFWNWVNIGVSSGYGYTSLETAGAYSVHEDTWSVSPFVGVAHTWGPFSASLTPTWTHTWTTTSDTPAGVGSGTDKTGKISVPLKLGYAITEKLKIQVTAKYTGITNRKDAIAALPEADNWASFGGKLTYQVVRPLSVYLEYAYDAFNDSYSNHNAHVGFTYSW